jgi:hypothetical protein
MIFGKIDKFLNSFDPRKRVRFSFGKVKFPRFKRGWLYLYMLFILFAHFSQIGIAHAPLAPKRAEAKVDNRVNDLKAFLQKYDSPLAPYAKTFISIADKYDFDWRFLPAIAGTESTFGLRYIRGTYNPFGWGSGRIRFSSWDNGIKTVAKALWEKYLLKGKRPLTIEGIGNIYAESSHWPKSVRYWMGKISSNKLANK